MPRRRIEPTYRFHKATGKAIVTYYDRDGQRRSMLLPGCFNSPESLTEYKRTLAILKANGSPKPQAETRKSADTTVNEVVLRYLTEHAAVYYVHPDTKEPTTEQAAIKEAVRLLVRLYGDLPIVEFDSLALEAVQMAMATGSALTDTERKKKLARRQPLGLARTTINRHVDRIKRIMRWGCAKKVVPSENLVNIEAVQSLKQGRSIARETEIVKPVDPEIVAKTVHYMAPCPADMV